MRLDERVMIYIYNNFKNNYFMMAKKTTLLTSSEQTHVRDVIEWTLNYYINNVFPGMYEIIKMKTGYTKDIEREIRKADPNKNSDSTYYIYPILEPNIDAFHANSFEIDTMWRVVPIQEMSDSIKASKDASDVVSWIEWVANRKDVEDMMRFEAETLWTTYCKVWTTMKQKIKLPFAEHISFFELFAVPWTKDFYQSRFLIHRNIMSEKQITSRYGKLVESKIKKIRKIVGTAFKDWDFNKIWELKLYETWIESYIEASTDTLTTVDLFNKALSAQFQVIDGENANHEVVEVREDGKCHLFINTEYITSYEEYTQSPFGCVVFEKQPWTYLGRWLWHKLMPSQLDANFAYNSLRRAIRQEVHPDTMTIPWALIDPTTSQSPVSLSYQWGKNYTVNATSLYGGKAFEKIQYAWYDIIAILQQRLSNIVSEAQMIAWTSSYTLGWQGKVERVAWGVAQKNSVFLARLQPMTASIKSMKSHMFHVWLEIAKQLDKSLIYKVSENWESSSIEDLSIDDIITKTYVMVDTETNKSIRRYENAELWTKILSVLSPFASIQDEWQTQKLMTSVLRHVIKNYAFEWDEEKMNAELPQEWITQSSLDKIKELEWVISGNDERWENLVKSSILSQIPAISNPQQPLNEQEF